MSTFEGRMKEYRLVSLDRFDGENLTSTVYFLSHMHSDHTVGLDSSGFFARLKQRGNSFLYCSAITRILLLGNEKRYGHLAPYVKTLETLCPTTIDVPTACDEDKNSTVLVTLLPAGHCLGSVMFLFEGDEGNVLYTGDFRWGMSEATQMPYLDPRAKPLRSIYVDTTFCSPKAFHIPSREQCESGVISLVDSYFQEHGSTGHIWVESRTSFGHEMLLKEISLHTKMKIHVVHWKKVLYDQIPGLKDIFTENPEETRIHAHPKDIYKRLEKNSLPCGYVPLNKTMHLIQIKPSTMWFTTLPEIVNIVQQHGERRYRACYSFHSSYAEIRDLIQYLKPARVFPSVIPTSKTFDQVQNILNSFLTTPHYKHFSSLESEEQPLGIMKISKKSFTDSVEDCVFDNSQNKSGNSQAESTNQNSESSYNGSHKSDSELDLYSDEESTNLSQTSASKDQPTEDMLLLSGSMQSNGSLPAYVEDNSDDSEYEGDEVSQSEHLKLQIDFDSSQPEDENKGSVERSQQNVLENSFLAEGNKDRKTDDLSSPAFTLKLEAEDYHYDEQKREKDLVLATEVSDANSNRQVDEVEKICSEKSETKEIGQGKIFGSQDVSSLQLDNLKSSQQICQDEKVSALADDCSGSNILRQRSVNESGIQGQTSMDESGIEEQRNTDEQNVCKQRSVCALDILAQTCVDELNVRGQTSVGESDIRRQMSVDESAIRKQTSVCELGIRGKTSVGESNNDEHKENPVGNDVDINVSLNGNSVDSYHSAEMKTMNNNGQEAKTDRKHNRLVTEKKNFEHFDFKLPELEGKHFSSKEKKKHKLNNDEEEGEKCSQDKYHKMDSDDVKWRLHGIPLEDNDVVEASDKKKEMSQIKLNGGETKKCQNKKYLPFPSGSQILDSNSHRRANANETLQENNHLIKCDNARSSFDNENKKNHQIFNSKDTTLHEGNVLSSCLESSVMAGADINLQMSNNAEDISSSQESENSVKIIQEISDNRRKLVVEISDSEDECIAIDSDSDITLPPSPGFLESSQELFSSSDAITDPSNICDTSDNDGVVIIKTSTPIQNGPEKRKKKKISFIKLD